MGAAIPPRIESRLKQLGEESAKGGQGLGLPRALRSGSTTDAPVNEENR